jgi:hypothetical protein
MREKFDMIGDQSFMKYRGICQDTDLLLGRSNSGLSVSCGQETSDFFCNTKVIANENIEQCTSGTQLEVR